MRDLEVHGLLIGNLPYSVSDKMIDHLYGAPVDRAAWRFGVLAFVPLAKSPRYAVNGI